MDPLTKELVAGNPNWTESGRGFVLTLYLTETSTSNNQSHISYKLVLSNPQGHYNWYYENWRGTPKVSLTIGGKDLSANVPNWYIGYNENSSDTDKWSQTLLSGTVSISHDEYGALENMPISASIPNLTSYDPDRGTGPYSMSVSGKWTLTKINIKCTITYNANGGIDAPEPQEYTYAPTGTITLSSEPGKPRRDGYEFLGWSLDSNAASASYTAGQAWSLTNRGDYTLHAVWKLAYLPIMLNNQNITQVKFNNQEVLHIVFNGTQIF